MKNQRNNILDIKSRKNRGSVTKEPIVCVAAYTYPIANLIDEFCDIILVGDSLGMTIYGMKNTLGVSVDMMINHGKAVVNATTKSLITVDMPFASYEASKEQAFINAARIITETGCQAVKIEMSEGLIDTVKFLSERGIPVMAHIGLTPQHINELGGFKVQGKDKISAKNILDLALESEKAGAFSLVIEGVVEKLANQITKNLTIPTIGIGASAECDGQVLVIDDILGVKQEYSPKFVRNYADLSKEIKKAVSNFSTDVKNHKFPTKDHCFY